VLVERGPEAEPKGKLVKLSQKWEKKKMKSERILGPAVSGEDELVGKAIRGITGPSRGGPEDGKIVVGVAEKG
jgi:hypothetical protein